MDGSYAVDLLGRQLCGKWRLVRILGSGGMSTVFEGRHRNGKRVAVKVLHPALAVSLRLRSRFKREAYLANHVAHPDAVSVLDDDVSEDGLLFLVMEYLEGETLGDLLKRTVQPMSEREVVAAAIGVLDVLVAAHDQGVVHRDVKPDNIFLTRRERRLKLLDFGIASLRDLSGLEVTGTGAVLGTPAFMAPEQARGHWASVDVTTDLWGVGATMFTLLTRRFVHEGTNANELLIAAATRPAPSLGSVIGKVAPDLAAIVDRALSFEKAARWQDAVSMLTALRALHIGETGAFTEPLALTAECDQMTEEESRAAGDATMFIETGGQTTPRVTTIRDRLRGPFAVGLTLAMIGTIGAWVASRSASSTSAHEPIERNVQTAAEPAVGSISTALLPSAAPPAAVGEPVPPLDGAAQPFVRIQRGEPARSASKHAPASSPAAAGHAAYVASPSTADVTPPSPADSTHDPERLGDPLDRR